MRRAQTVLANVPYACHDSVERGRPLPVSRVDRAVLKVAQAAGIGHVSSHQLRHTLATQAINRGMALEALAALCVIAR
jgi:integrase